MSIVGGIVRNPYPVCGINVNDKEIVIAIKSGHESDFATVRRPCRHLVIADMGELPAVRVRVRLARADEDVQTVPQAIHLPSCDPCGVESVPTANQKPTGTVDAMHEDASLPSKYPFGISNTDAVGRKHGMVDGGM